MIGKELLKTKAYEFLKTDPHLGTNIIFLTYGGSHAYGTEVIGSDVDIRGCAVNCKSDILGFTKFEQVTELQTDTTVYGFNKLIHLLISCNPNTIELLGCKSEHYMLMTPIGQEMLDHRTMFLSKRAVYSFGGYATQQLRRLENALARDAYPPEVKERHIMGSCTNASYSFLERYQNYKPEQIQLSIQDIDQKPQIVADVRMDKFPLRSFIGMINELTEIAKHYDKLNHRNQKKDDMHLNKHAMHLIRLYLMCIDILEQEEIITYREKDHALLMSIRSGGYQNEDHTFRPEFFALIHDLEQKLEYATSNTGLPNHPNMKWIEEYTMSVNERVVRGEF